MPEGETRVILQTERPPASGLLFALTPGPATRTRPVFIGGGTGGFANLSVVYELAQALGLQSTLVMPEKLIASLPIAGVVVLPSQPGKVATDFWQLTEAAGVVVLGLDMHPTSTEQILLSRLIKTANTAMLVTDELASLFRIEPELLQVSQIVPFFAVSTIRQQALGLQAPVRLVAERGVYGVADLLKSMDTKSQLVIAYDTERLYSYVPTENCLIHTPLPAGMTVARLRRLVVMSLLLTWFARGQSAAPTELMQAAHYIVYSLSAQMENSSRADATALRNLFEQA